MNRRRFLLETGTTATALLAGGLLARGAEGSPAPGKTRIGIIGFQHFHIWSIVTAMQARSDVEIVAACEEDPGMRAEIARGGKVRLTHTDYHQLLAESGIDAIVVGEPFAKRGRVIIDCLKSGRPVLCDKPLCTTLADYDAIARLSREKNLPVTLMLHSRDQGVFIKMRELVRSGEVGDVREIAVSAEHPLKLSERPPWFHAAGGHGGTINDVGVHGFDLIPWITGLNFKQVTAARAWQTAGLPPGSHFQNAGQAMLEMENGAGMVGSYSYVSPTSMAYTLPMYWRITVWGSAGTIEGSWNYREVMLYKEGEKTPRAVPNAPARKGGFVDSFLRQVHGQPSLSLTTADALRATLISLKTQQAADQRLHHVAL